MKKILKEEKFIFLELNVFTRYELDDGTHVWYDGKCKLNDDSNFLENQYQANYK